MTMHYFVSLGHLYLVHVGIWGSYYGFVLIKDDKGASLEEIIKASLLLAIFSAVAHNHMVHILKGGL